MSTPDQDKVAWLSTDTAIRADPANIAAGWSMLNDSVNWTKRDASAVRHWLRRLEGLNLALERPINRLVRQPQLNPLYHTGTITVFALLVILLTGIYLTLFYQFGFQASYQAVAAIERNLIGRLIRALHRYASGLALIAALLHGWRTLFMDRFRGPRWLAWLTGVILAALIWTAGVTGYWLLFDQRAQLLNQTLVSILQGSSAGTAFLNRFLTTAKAGSGWLFALLVITAHLGVSALIGLLFWFHIRRLSRPKLLPPGYWMWLLGGLLTVAALLVPAELLPPAALNHLPGRLALDALFLSYLPMALHWPPAAFWGATILVLLLLGALPWLLKGQPPTPVAVHTTRCTGCTLCAADCPYQAIAMVERDDGRRHKYLARVDPALCVSCGICIGTCRDLALTLDGQPAEALWEQTIARVASHGSQPVKVVFTCERHAYHGARSYLLSAIEQAPANGSQPTTVGQPHIEVVPLTCIAMAHPDLAVRALEAGASEVQFVGCPPEDCTNREGNLWMQERLERQRLPRLRRAYAQAAISSAWLPPDDFARGVQSTVHQTRATAYGTSLRQLGWRHTIPALVLLAVVMAGQVWLSRVPFTPYPNDQALVEITLDHRPGYPTQEENGSGSVELTSPHASSGPVRLSFHVDGASVWQRTYRPGGQTETVHALGQVVVASGRHHLRLLMWEQGTPSQPLVLYDQVVTLENGQKLALHYKDARLAADPARGKKLYYETSLGTNAGCRICHSLEPGVILVGPSFAGIATRAAQRVPGMSAEDYLYQSIVDPDAYVVEGFPAGQMIPDLAEILTEEQIRDLVAFLMTLK